MSEQIAIQMNHITKTFGQTVANHDVTMDIRRNEILSLLGENGSGKTTLMNMLSGIYFPDSGEIFIDGKQVTIQSPKDAFDLGIGMIHQHFKLIDVFDSMENILLGLESTGKDDIKNAREKVKAICDRYGFDLNLDQKVYDMNVSQKQTLEIVKTLYRGAEILILDEPTTVLTPQETEKLFNVMRNMRDDGKAIIIITHKLNEVLEISDRVTILRKGEYVGTIDTKDANESIITEMMVGQKIELNINRSDVKDKVLRLDVNNLTIKNVEKRKVVNGLSFQVFGGEILGIAGISGCGQKELLEGIAGLQKIRSYSKITYYAPDGKEKNISNKNPKTIRNLGIRLSFVPEDRLGMGLVGNMGMTDNMMLKNYNHGISPFLNKKKSQELAQKIKDDLEVVTPDVNYPVRRLSGGNVQKVLVGREIADHPTVLMTAYAVRGLDINTSYTIYNLLNEQKEKGVAVIFVGEDLDVLLSLCDRILVLCEGHLNGILDARTCTKEEVGYLMTNLKEGGK